MVAVKKSKINSFNERDGVLFYAMREVQVLQKMSGSKHVCKLLDVFYTGGNSIGIVTEYFDNSLDKVLQSNVPKEGRDRTRFEESDSDEEEKET